MSQIASFAKSGWSLPGGKVEWGWHGAAAPVGLRGPTPPGHKTRL